MTKEIHDINTKALDFVVELIGYIFAYPDDDYMTMECLCRKLHKHGLIDKKDGEWTTNFIERKTEPSDSEKPNNPQTCANCKFGYEGWFGEACNSCCNAHSNWQPKTEPQTDYRITGTIGYRCPKCGRGNFLKNESNCFYCGEPLIKTKSQTETHDIRTDTHECVKTEPQTETSTNEEKVQLTDCAWKGEQP